MLLFIANFVEVNHPISVVVKIKNIESEEYIMTKRKLLEENTVLKEQIKELKNELLGTQRQLLYK